ncbi:MAG: CheR family methyltransferase [Nanoarchaeota archaeon]
MMNNNFISIIKVDDPQNWQFLKGQIKKYLNFDTHNYRDTFLMRRVECRLRKLQINSYMEYTRLLSASDEEKKLLEKELTIHVTRFFRDKSLFKELMTWIFPQFIKEKMEMNNYSISVWSAGCSSGEEAYSIAIVFKEVLGDNIKNFLVKIHGTDLEPKTIERAKTGAYEESALMEMPDELKEKYFTYHEGLYYVVPQIKNMVKFEVGDMLNPSGQMIYDIIFCRNTVIYFEKKTKQDLYESLFSKLKKGGFLILGKTEFLDGSAKPRFQMYNANERIYRKPFSETSAMDYINA